MCIFSDDPISGEPGVEVHGTRIFARPDGPRQVLAYEMSLTSAREVAMILPLPVPIGAGDDAVQFIDLQHYAGLFDDLEACFQEDKEEDLDCLFNDDDGGGGVLRVHRVGAFEASYVPGLADFVRLDPRFRLPERIWQALPWYADWGFTVIQLQAGRLQVHPIALSFPRRWPAHLFFPTVHVHDGEVRPEARFDHMLYYQGMTAPSRQGAASERAVRSNALHPTSKHVAVAATEGLVDGALAVERLRLVGERPNEDVWLTTG